MRPASAAQSRDRNEGGWERPMSAFVSRKDDRPKSAKKAVKSAKTKMNPLSTPQLLKPIKRKKKVTYQKTRNLEEGWNSNFTKDVLAPVSGSGFRALRPKKVNKEVKSKIPITMKPTCLFTSTVASILQLWGELKIPVRDREFFFDSYCRKSEPEEDAVSKVNEQFHLLSIHKEQTLDVLKTIETREYCLHTLRKELSDFQEDGWASDISSMLGSLQQASIAVIRAITVWREKLWRPQPFVWDHKNYLIKMQSDSSFIADVLDPKCTDTITFSDSSYLDPSVELSAEKIRNCVVNEATIFQELQAEQKRLLESGYYIPMLRWSPVNENIQDILQNDTHNYDVEAQNVVATLDDILARIRLQIGKPIEEYGA